ncbi:site-specific integrase [Tenacibaculum pacificus]|uniref:site-specific integrase n=1 Tax=Tenacibaculum pacificus TaxID=3018314 RepID=UPI0022F3A7C2|nr:site-specific integrase [Tenacibaculum pacificus]WBX74748.1 site-specific integrase [Tenacibaculum pacificus]
MTKVTLRQKPISKGRNSLYLDFYPPLAIAGTEKTTRREFLGLFVLIDKTAFKKELEAIENKELKNKGKLSKATLQKKELLKTLKPLTAVQKNTNRETLATAEIIKQKRINELNKPEIYTAFELEQRKATEKGKLSFITYFEQQMDKAKGNNYNVWLSVYNYLNEYTKGNLLFIDLNEKFCNDFRGYLLTAKSKRSTTSTLSQNTAKTYFNKFKATLKQAYKDDFISYDLNAKIDTIKEADTKRVFLTIEELNKLIQADCVNPILKQASLFSALTGLRFSDIEKLKWSEITHNKEQGYFLEFKQQKTQSNEYLPISEQAYNLLGKPKEPQQKVFEGLKYSAHQNTYLLKWAINAGVQKHLTFQCF